MAFMTSAGENIGTITWVEPTWQPAAQAAIPARWKSGAVCSSRPPGDTKCPDARLPIADTSTLLCESITPLG